MGHSNRGQYNRKMKHFAIIFSLLQISLCFEGHDKCDGLCKLGEGDCNYDSDCVEGLKCDSDGWFGKDVCIAGPKTKNGFVTPWSEWSKCSNSACGTLGVISRYRSCIPPEFGGRECPPNDHTHSYGQHRSAGGIPAHPQPHLNLQPLPLNLQPLLLNLQPPQPLNPQPLPLNPQPPWLSTPRQPATQPPGSSSPGPAAPKRILATSTRETATMIKSALVIWFVERTTAQRHSQSGGARTGQIAVSFQMLRLLESSKL